MVAGKSLPLFFVGTMLAINLSMVIHHLETSPLFINLDSGQEPRSNRTCECLILTAIFYAKKLNKMSMLTLPDFYFRRYGNASEGVSESL